MKYSIRDKNYLKGKRKTYGYAKLDTTNHSIEIKLVNPRMIGEYQQLSTSQKELFNKLLEALSEYYFLVDISLHQKSHCRKSGRPLVKNRLYKNG